RPSTTPCSARWRPARTASPNLLPRRGRPGPATSANRPTPPGCAAFPTIPARCCARASATNTCAAAPTSADRMSAAILSGRLLKTMLVAVLLLAPGLAGAEVRAWLDRDRIELGESATLNIETDGGGRPDY